MTHHRSRSLAGAAFALALSPNLLAQIWTESGDAGATLATAQAVYGNAGFPPFSEIQGSIQGDVDLYLLHIEDAVGFSATSTGPDLSLYLFDEQGRAIAGCENFVAGNPSATLTNAFVPGPGRYFLAVAAAGVRPVSALGAMWATGFIGEAKPLGIGGRETLTGWTGTSTISGNYLVDFPVQTAMKVLKQAQLPYDHHLSENPNVQGSLGTSAYFPTTGGRFQILYEAPEFWAEGINYPINPCRVRFRGEDGEVNLGGVSWNYTATFAATSLGANTLSSSFATNLASGTTTIIASTTSTARAGAAIGSTPNNPCLTLEGPSLALTAFDPTGPRPNLLIDVVLQPATVPTGRSMVPLQDANTAGTFRKGLVASSPAATTGTFAAPLVMALEYTAFGGPNSAGPEVLLQPARNERIGNACGGTPASFYEAFLTGQAFDLGGFTLTPDNAAAPTRYTVTRGAFPFNTAPVNAAPNSTLDDGLVVHGLGFNFRYPGGSTPFITACTNGFLWLDNVTTNSDFTPTVAEFLGQTGNLPARFAPCWYDLHCGRNTGIPNSGLHVKTDTSGGPGHAVCYVTWRQVGVFNQVAQSGHCVYDMQCVLREDTGVVEFRYLNMPRFCAHASSGTDLVPALVGFTPGYRNGAPAADPQNRDLSLEMPFTTGMDSVDNLSLTPLTTWPSGATAYGGRLVNGAAVRWRTDNIPAGTLLGVHLLSLESSRPGLQIPTITAPGCVLSTGLNVVLWDVNVLPGNSVTTSTVFQLPFGVVGAELHSQYVVLGGLFGAPDLVTMTSHGLKQTVGHQ
jgi:hypothetical protein